LAKEEVSRVYNRNKRKIFCRVLLLWAFGLFLGSAWESGYAQEYIIGRDDVLQITFLEQPDLNTIAKVGRDGNIELPVVGTLEAAGRTTKELANLIVTKMSLYSSDIVNVSVIVRQYGSKKIYVTGEVGNPGKYPFETVPGLWEVISEAGGPTPRALLTDITIIRSRKGENRVLKVDLPKIWEEGDLSKIPPLEPGDMVYIPASPVSGTSGVNLGGAGRNIIYIYGEVIRQGIYPYTPNLHLLEALISAGGPTRYAKLKDVRVVRKEGNRITLNRVNVEHYTEGKARGFFPLKPGDTIFVPHHRPFREGLTLEFLRIALTAALTALAYRAIR